MNSSSPKTLNWRDVLAALRLCTGERVVIRDGRTIEPAGSIRTRAAAKGTELCLFGAETAAERTALIEQLQTLAATSGRRYMAAARARIGESALPVDSVGDEEIDGAIAAVVRTRRPKLGFNQSQQTGSSTTLRSKRIKTG